MPIILQTLTILLFLKAFDAQDVAQRGSDCARAGINPASHDWLAIAGHAVFEIRIGSAQQAEYDAKRVTRIIEIALAELFLALSGIHYEVIALLQTFHVFQAIDLGAKPVPVSRVVGVLPFEGRAVPFFMVGKSEAQHLVQVGVVGETAEWQDVIHLDGIIQRKDCLAWDSTTCVKATGVLIFPEFVLQEIVAGNPVDLQQIFQFHFGLALYGCSPINAACDLAALVDAFADFPRHLNMHPVERTKFTFQHPYLFNHFPRRFLCDGRRDIVQVPFALSGVVPTFGGTILVVTHTFPQTRIKAASSGTGNMADTPNEVEIAAESRL